MTASTVNLPTLKPYCRGDKSPPTYTASTSLPVMSGRYANSRSRSPFPLLSAQTSAPSSGLNKCPLSGHRVLTLSCFYKEDCVFQLFYPKRLALYYHQLVQDVQRTEQHFSRNPIFRVLRVYPSPYGSPRRPTFAKGELCSCMSRCRVSFCLIFTSSFC